MGDFGSKSMKSSIVHRLLLNRIEIELACDNEVLSLVFIGRERCDDILFLVKVEYVIFYLEFTISQFGN